MAATLCALALPGVALAQNAPIREAEAVPPAAALTGATTSQLHDAVARFGIDRAALLRRHDAPYSAARRDRLRTFYLDWLERLASLPFDSWGVESRIDYVLLRSELAYQLSLLDREERMAAEMAPLLPFLADIVRLQEQRRDLHTIDPPAAAHALALLATAVDETRGAVEAGVRNGTGGSNDARADNGARPAPVGRRASAQTGRTADPLRTTPIIALRTAATVNNLRQTLQRWYRFYSGYDPLFTWWAAEPYARANDALEVYARSLRERVVGIREGEDEPILGDPIGADALTADLAHEMIPYTPAELVAIAEREFAWCEEEMKRAARDMGYGDDWKAALEDVKTRYVEPGRQTELTRTLALEAIEFLETRDLVTVPPLAKEVWRMEMLSPEQQQVAPFYLGGEVIQVAFPTDGMTHEDKLMAMRGNNVHFSRAVVHHELIPGHHLQGYMTSRYNPHRRAFSTPFWSEGNAVYWEMVLWDEGFPQSPEDRIGMLFWRMHRAARIIFSLNVHLGTMTGDEAIDFLVDRVGHERANATAEVRRSLNGSYPPLYQAAYMLGALQFRALQRELVDSGQMTARDYHDAILQGGSMPVEMVRARLLGVAPARDHEPGWRFSGNP
ncbi:MAG: DUF885 family protein [Gemmatimonadetes bacterium]|nr:DUF885 family protein [Gemmatimonadota bacterium]